jgi:hypothetical protein
MARPLLTSRQSSIAIAAYAVPVGAVAHLLPEGVRPDVLPAHLTPAGLEKPEDAAVVSLAGLTNERTRFVGVSIPGQGEYSELALRIHARRDDRRGVMNIKRYVSRSMIAMAGARLFGERCERQAVSVELRQQARTIDATYTIDYRPGMLVPGPGQLARLAGTAGKWSFTIGASKPWTRPEASGAAQWLNEARWVFTGGGAQGSAQRGGTMIHEVLHPLWSVYPVGTITVDMDFANLFGPDWGFLSQQAPFAGALAAGSEVAVFGRMPTVQVLWSQRRKSSPAAAAGVGARRKA